MQKRRTFIGVVRCCGAATDDGSEPVFRFLCEDHADSNTSRTEDPLRTSRKLLAALALAVACSRSETPAPRTDSAPAKSAANETGQLVRRLETDLPTLNYLLQTTDYERNVQQYLYDPIVDIGANLQPIPGIAKSWEISPDGTTYTLHLDDRATFSDGSPVRASDVVFTLKKLISEESPQFLSWFDSLDLEKTVAVDERTVRAVFKEPRVAQLLSFNIGVLPEKVYGKGNFKTDFNDNPVGAGPYKLVKREPGRSILLTRRDDYRLRPLPPIRNVLFQIIADDTVAWQAMKRGDIDEMRLKNDMWVIEKDRADVKDRITFHNAWLLSYNCIAWNGKNALLKDRAVRRAFARAFDVQGVIKHVYHDQARPVTGPFTPDSFAYDPSVPAIPFDPAAATRELNALGWTDTNGDGILERAGKPLQFEMLIPAGNKISADQSQIFQQALAKAGVKMNIRTMDGAAFFDALMNGKYEAAFLSWSSDPDPDPYALFHSSQLAPNGLNVVAYANPAADKLMDDARREFDATKRRAMYHQLHRVLADDQPYLWTLQVASKWAVNRRVENVQASKGFGLFLWYPGPLGWSLSK